MSMDKLQKLHEANLIVKEFRKSQKKSLPISLKGSRNNSPTNSDSEKVDSTNFSPKKILSGLEKMK